MLVVNHRDRPVMHSASGHPSLSMVVNHEVGARSMSIWTTYHEPREVVPLHTHEYEEIITVIAGEAVMTVAGESAPGERGHECYHPAAYAARIQKRR